MNINYKDHLEKLRKEYYEAFPEQRLHVGRQRIDNPSHGPNQIIAYVSVIEGLLRSLVIWGETASGKPTLETYKKHEFSSTKKLFKNYLEQRKAEVKEVMPIEKYELVVYAVKYRNLLSHECTSLGQDKYPELLEACELFLQGLVKHAGIRNS